MNNINNNNDNDEINLIDQFEVRNEAEYYICPICHRICHEVVQILTDGCGHIFCSGCIQEYINHRVVVVGGTITCPVCRREIENRESDIRVDSRTQREINQLRIKCQFRSDGCNWIGPYSEYDHHIHNDCEALRNPLEIDMRTVKQQLAELKLQYDGRLHQQANQIDQLQQQLTGLETQRQQRQQLKRQQQKANLIRFCKFIAAPVIGMLACVLSLAISHLSKPTIAANINSSSPSSSSSSSSNYISIPLESIKFSNQFVKKM